MNTFRLQPHPTTPCDFIEALEVAVERHTDGVMRCRYELRGAIDRVALPAVAPSPTRTDDLWRHTCFELFLKPEGGALYDEFNFSPSGNWAAWRFEHYRTGRVELDFGVPPRIDCRNDTGRLTLEALIASSECAGARLALSTVLEDRDGAIYYWALQHPPGKPDFHHEAGFTTHI